MSADLHTPGPWRVGKGGGCVVADTKSHPHSDDRDLGYYGGYLIAESIARSADAEILAQAPDFAEVLGHPGFRSLALVYEMTLAKWLYRVEIAVESNYVRTFYNEFAGLAIREAAMRVRECRRSA